MKTMLWRVSIAVVLLALAATPRDISNVSAQDATSQYFPETQHTVRGVFLKYWQEHGGLAQQGFPISEEFAEVSDLDGQSYTVQYFERAVFEHHPEKQPPYDVLLSQLGTFQYKTKYGDAGAPNQQPDAPGGQLFTETGHSVSGLFLDYWKTHGGLAQQGYPISNEFTEVSDLDGKSYTVQYFERAVFESHPENQPPFNVLLSQLGTYQLKKKYPDGPQGGGGQPQPQATPTTASPPPPPPSDPTPPPSSTKTNCEQNVDPTRKSTVSHTGPVAISNVHYQGDEYVELTNTGSAPADIGRWTLRDKNETDQRFVFPAGTILSAGSTIQIFTKPGANRQYDFGRGSPIWNDCGDALELLDSHGTVVATYAYGTHVQR